MKFLVMGTAPSLNDFDLSELQDLQNDGKVTTIGCNGILRTGFMPSYLMISDRRPYIPELEAGHLEEYAERGVLLLSSTLWDRGIRSGDAPVQERPSFPFEEWRVGTCSTAFNWTSFTTPLCSFATTAGQMLQGAVILGATEIGILGVDLVATKGNLHAYKDTVDRKEATIQKDGKTMGPEATYKRFREAKVALDKMGIPVLNLSKTEGTMFGKIFDKGGYHDFIAKG